MNIVFWSPTQFAGRKSTHLLLLALSAIAREGGEQLVLHADSEGSGPEHFLLSGRQRARMMEEKEFGIELLDRFLGCTRFEKELVVNAAYTFAEGKLHILPPGSALFYEEKEKAAEAVLGIIKRATGVFENVWVELPAGVCAFSEQILLNADLVVINLAQSPRELARIDELPSFKGEYFLIGAYEQRSIYSLYNMMLLHPRLRGRAGVIPYERRLLAACCAGEAETFWKRESDGRREEEKTWLYGEVRKIYDVWKEKEGEASGVSYSGAGKRLY